MICGQHQVFGISRLGLGRGVLGIPASLFSCDGDRGWNPRRHAAGGLPSTQSSSGECSLQIRGALQGTLRLTWEVVSETGLAVELEQGKYPLAYAKSRVAGGKPTEVALFVGLGTLLLLPLLPEAMLFLRRRRSVDVASV